jgi:hypothetical protein
MSRTPKGRTLTNDQQQALTMLRGFLKRGDTVFTSLEHVSRSGMQRVIQCHVFRGGKRNPDHYVLGYNVARLCGYRYDREREGVVIGGAGMDMGFALVYDLSRVMFDDGYALTQRWL